MMTAVVLTYNEERCIARCLTSLEDYFEEVVVIDSGSTDNTVAAALAVNSNVQIITVPWENSFAIARNHALAIARGDWVVFIDADEWFAPGSAACLARWLTESAAAKKVDHTFAFQVRDVHMRGWYPTVGRVVRRDAGWVYHGAVHERLVHSATCEPVAVTVLHDVVINHDGYSAEVEADKKKHVRNWELLSPMLKQFPNDALLLKYAFRDHLHHFEDMEVMATLRKYAIDAWHTSADKEILSAAVSGIIAERRYQLAESLLAEAKELAVPIELTSLLAAAVSFAARQKQARRDLAVLVRTHGQRLLDSGRNSSIDDCAAWLMEVVATEVGREDLLALLQGNKGSTR